MHENRKLTEKLIVKKAGFLILICVFIVACAFLFNGFYHEAKKNAVRQLNEEQTIHARQASHGIEEFFSTWTGILVAFSKMDEIIDIDSNGKRHMEFFYEAHKEQIRSVTRVDERGTILYTVPYKQSIGSNISGQAHMREILEYHKPVISDVFRSVQGFDAVALHVPVFKGSAFKGTLAIVVNFQGLSRRYLEVIKIGKTGRARVISRDGTELYSPVPGHVGKSVFENYKDVPSILEMTREMLKGKEGNATYTIYGTEGRTLPPVRQHAVYMPIRVGNTFWSIVVASSEEEVLSSLASFRNKLLLITGVILLGGIVFSTMFVKAWLIIAEEGKRKRAEEELRYSEEKFFKAFHATPDAIVISRASDGLLLEVNEVFLQQSGYSREEALNRTTIELNLWADPRDRERYAAGLRESGRVREMEAGFRTKSGAILDGLVSGEGVVLGDELCLLTIIRDITERKKTDAELQKYRMHLEDLVNERTEELKAANEKLKELDRLKSMFIASMSHELRTPLNSIIGFTGILLQGLAGPLNEEQRKQLGMVKGSSHHLLELITDIIDISKIEAGKISLSLESFDLSTTVRAALDSFQPAAGRKSVRLELETPDRLQVASDERRVMQVLVNLIGNAVKFTQTGTVSVSVSEKDGMVSVAVRDSGPGIRPEDMGKLFRYFSQIISSDMPKHEGTGLGLYLSRKLMILLGGDILADSEFGKGSVFTMIMPVKEKERV